MCSEYSGAGRDAVGMNELGVQSSRCFRARAGGGWISPLGQICIEDGRIGEGCLELRDLGCVPPGHVTNELIGVIKRVRQVMHVGHIPESAGEGKGCETQSHLLDIRCEPFGARGEDLVRS